MEKKDTFTLHKNGFALRSHNKKVVATELPNKKGINLKFMYFNTDNEEENPTCGYHRIRGVDCTELAITKEAILKLAQGLYMFEQSKELKYFPNAVEQIILDKIGIKQKRSANFILANEDLCRRVLEETPIWVEDFIKKYDLSQPFVEKLIDKNLVSYFTNQKVMSERIKGRKVFIFEEEAVAVIGEGMYNQSFFRIVDTSIKVFFQYAPLFLSKRELNIVKRALLDKEPIDLIAKSLKLSPERVRQLFHTTLKKTERYMRTMEKHTLLKDKVKSLRFTEKVLKQTVEGHSKAIGVVGDDLLNMKVRDLDLSLRAKNCLFSVEIE